MAFEVGQVVRFAGADSVVRRVTDQDGAVRCLIENGPARIPMWLPEEILQAHQAPGHSDVQFVRHAPDLIVVDDFLGDPDEVRAIALAQEYHSDLRYFKGLRSTVRFLWPHLREEFGRLVGRPVTRWLEHSANGCFQQTGVQDPLVWHHDTQQYAGAIYLTPDPPAGSGTSFWRDKTYGCRHRPDHPDEVSRLGSPEAVEGARKVVYDPYNIEHPDNWELVESIAGLYNRLVIWDAQLIHSATSYEKFGSETGASTRLVQLFFFDCG